MERQGDLEENIDWREPFEWQEPPEWAEAQDLTELAEQMLADPKLEAATWLLYNREKARQLYGWPEALHTPPAAEHYPHTYLWDSGFAEIIFSQAALFAGKAAEYLDASCSGHQTSANYSRLMEAMAKLREKGRRFLRAAVEESFWVVDGQKDTGFIPNLQYAPGRPRWFEIEWYASLDKVRRSSNYTQPPVLPLAALSTYKTMRELDDPNSQLYGEEIYSYLDKFMNYFDEFRVHASDDRRIGVIEHHETGMDSLEQWDYTKPLRPVRFGADSDPKQDFETRIIDGAYFVIRLFERYFAAGDDLKKQRELSWDIDMGMNGIYFHNLQAMARLSRELGRLDKAEFYENLANEVESQLLEKNFIDDPDKVPCPGFYSQKADGEPIPTITVSNLFALVLPHMREYQLEATLNMMDEHCDTLFPLPSGSSKSPAFDPHNNEKDRLWRGPTWINANYYIAEFGLRMQAERTDIRQDLRDRAEIWADRLTLISNQLLDMNHQTELAAQEALDELVEARHTGDETVKNKEIITGAFEFFNPLTGEGQRPRVRNFTWSWLARFMTKPKSNLSSFLDSSVR